MGSMVKFDNMSKCTSQLPAVDVKGLLLCLP